jgi:hypothetical protein
MVKAVATGILACTRAARPSCRSSIRPDWGKGRSGSPGLAVNVWVGQVALSVLGTK